MDLCDSGQRPMAALVNIITYNSSYANSRKFLEQLSDYKLLNKESIAWE
jgi:hypothetical protein